MCELVACYILSTWFLEALTVIGYFWPNGERGSGKTQLLNVITELAYLGQTILAGGSYASLRDLADYGATLAFDDAEAIMDVKRTDPDKRALLLAGNRRGSLVTVREPVNGREWRTRYINTFCPRLFSAIRMPDPVLASRTIVVPLIRTPDRYRANADPLNYALWPHAREQVLDDLWALGLCHIRGIVAHAEHASEDGGTERSEPGALARHPDRGGLAGRPRMRGDVQENERLITGISKRAARPGDARPDGVGHPGTLRVCH